ncbi:phage Gp37/Gp68 family protein [Mycobacteroides chelonae]|uniref:DUF5131 family protein n=1 Tax=Mycobacteroides chelonae TaxID=1774 RepID=UPI001C2C1F0B|nr:phage Gp37/Gp68 family protein [Mycobacteroides chelonae]MBV0920624.1 phage Gp37/Gp68 family protein [Mycobacteroides chelonae]
MGDKTRIEWTDATWNPVTGCDKVSPGCDHCYAETFAERWRGTRGHYFETGFDVQLRPDKLDLPLRWTKPRRIFVNSMSDLFHDSVPDAYIGSVFDVMARAEQHTFQILTKRHGRMRALLRKWEQEGAESVERGELHPKYGAAAWRRRDGLWCTPRVWPLPNVWLGVSAEDQQRADLRIAALLDTPAAARFVSAEPLLGAINLPSHWLHPVMRTPSPENNAIGRRIGKAHGVGFIDWVIVGGESGPGARPMHPDWARSLRDQCVAAGVPFLFKQWGETVPLGQMTDEARRRWDDHHGCDVYPEESLWRLGKKRAGRELDGRTWDQYPRAVR